MSTITVGGRDCVHGFDWSYWQAPRDLRGARAAGHQFFVVKASEGESYRDPLYGQHVANGLAADLTVGAYHFARPDWSDGSGYADGRQEAGLFLGAIDDRIAFVVLDLEATVLNEVETTAFVVGWFDEIIRSGRFPGRSQRLLYVGKWFNWWHTQAAAGQACLWIPSYTAGYEPDVDPSFIDLPGWSSDLWPEGWCVWQYSATGTVAGLHPSDVNVATVDWLHEVLDEGDMDHTTDPFPTPEVTEMARAIYRFPDGYDNENAGYTIDLRSGAYPNDEGEISVGPHWYHTDDPTEVAALIFNRELNPADTRYFGVAAGDPNFPGGGPEVDRLYGAWPHVYRTADDAA